MADPNFANVEKWRKHPMLKGGLRYMFPGVGVGVVLFGITYAAQMATAKPSDGHH